ncbi:unnamed protein product [Acanthosepion pharaonis]|uniref:PWWP domain-containing protein n=1 Tax=Acanthosepion pharaonis TaxID=158019 RepID=A0A812DDK5_ACAPH|nr:unnamed protein product [Sepia pharaonis]
MLYFRRSRDRFAKMAASFKVGDLVWAKMKGFCAWPARIIEPMSEVKRPTSKKNHHFVFFFGSENYAWVQEDSIWSYADNKAKFTVTNRIPRGYNVAIEAIEDVIKAMPSQVPVKTSDLPSIDEELAQIFPNRSSSSGPHKDYTREPLSGKKLQEKSSASADSALVYKKQSSKKLMGISEAQVFTLFGFWIPTYLRNFFKGTAGNPLQPTSNGSRIPLHEPQPAVPHTEAAFFHEPLQFLPLMPPSTCQATNVSSCYQSTLDLASVQTQ